MRVLELIFRSTLAEWPRESNVTLLSLEGLNVTLLALYGMSVTLLSHLPSTFEMLPALAERIIVPGCQDGVRGKRVVA